MGFVIWNYAVMGVISVHWKSPLVLQQIYLVFMSVVFSFMLIQILPGWTVWSVLIFIGVWDLIAVLCPFGPLRLLINLFQERGGEVLPGLLYTTMTMYYIGVNAISIEQEDANEETSLENELIEFSSLPSISGKISNKSNYVCLDVETAIELNCGIKLGLGDFIFYSVLIGKAATLGDCNTIIACYIGILFGLAITTILVAIYKTALPALPISIFFGLVFCYSTQATITPFTSELSIRQYAL